MKIWLINDKDFSNVFTPEGYTVSYIKRRGNNAGQMESGMYRDDVRAIKAVVTGICMPTNEDQLQELLTEIAAEYVDLFYFDPKAKSYRTVKAMPSEPNQKYRGENCNAVDYWTGTVIAFTEV